MAGGLFAGIAATKTAIANVYSNAVISNQTKVNALVAGGMDQASAQAKVASDLQAQVAANQAAAAAADAARQAQAASGFGGFVNSLAGPVQTALAQTPLAPLAGSVADLAQGNYRGAAANAAAVGVEAALQATPLGDVPVLGQIAEAQAGNFVKNLIQGQPPAQAAQVAVAGATQAVAKAVISGGIPGLVTSIPSQPSKNGTGGAPPGMAPGQAPDAVAQAVANSAAHVQAVVNKPYGKVFPTRSAWEAFAARPETAGGTIGFSG